VETTIAQNVHTFRYDTENEKLRNSGRFIKPRNSCQHTIKSTFSLIIDAISSPDQRLESSALKHKTNGTSLRHKLALKNPVSGDRMRFSQLDIACKDSLF